MRTRLLVALLLGLRVFAEHRDLLLQAMCADKCSKGKLARNCRETCYSDPPEKPGICGNSTDPFLNACLMECQGDKDCADMDKCCSHQCGRTCQPPNGLQFVPDLPPVPENVTLLQISDMKNMMVDWKHQGGCQFVIEIRAESGPWYPAHKAPRITHPLRVTVRPGVEYEVRVAAVSERGSRGFSKPSNTAMIPLEAKPPEAPKDLKFKGSWRNGSVSGLLSWQPVEPYYVFSKYNVQWSHRIQVEGSHPNSKKGPLEVQRKSMPYGMHCLRIRKLLANKTYTFTVQARMFYGSERVTSKKATLIVDTSKYSSLSKRGKKRRAKKRFHMYYKILQINDGHKVKISWPKIGRMTYAVSWENDCDSQFITIITNGTHYVIPEVKKGCSYHVSIHEESKCKKIRKLGKLAFKVP